jgi:hypothetical protein
MLFAPLLLLQLQDPAPPVQAPLRRECFVIEAPGAPGSAREPLGWAEFLRRESAGGMVLECEYVFVRDQRAERWRVKHVEQLDHTGPRLVWREIGTAAGRTLTLERAHEGEDWHCQAFERDEAVRCAIDTSHGAVFPLYLLELARKGQFGAAELYLFDPLETALVPRTVSTVYTPASGGHARTLEIQRRDGTLAGRYEFEGTELVSIQWQEGGPRGRRIDPLEYARAVGGAVELARPRVPPAACSDSAK